jgi:hypothetical protein
MFVASIEDCCSIEFFDTSLGFDIHQNDRASDPHGGVLLAVKKDLLQLGFPVNPMSRHARYY